MTRSKFSLTFIENNSRRKSCYKKRKSGFTKKIEQLTTLCGVEACTIIYSHFDEVPQIWPADHSAFLEILRKFKNLPIHEQNRKMMTQTMFTKQRMKKTQDQCKKLGQENRHKEIKFFMSDSLAGETQKDFNLNDLYEMQLLIYFTVQTISQQFEILTGQSQFQASTPISLMPNSQTSGMMINPAIQTAGFVNGNSPVVAPEEPSPTRGINVMVPNSVVAPSGTATVQNEEQGLFSNVYRPVFSPETPQNLTWSMNSMVPNQQSVGFGDSNFNASFAPKMVLNDPENSRSGMTTTVPTEQLSSGSSNDFDWISYLLEDKDGGIGFNFP